MQERLISLENIIIDAKSGVSGAGTFSTLSLILQIIVTFNVIQVAFWHRTQDVEPRRQIFTLKYLKAYMLMGSLIIAMVIRAISILFILRLHENLSSCYLEGHFFSVIDCLHILFLFAYWFSYYFSSRNRTRTFWYFTMQSNCQFHTSSNANGNNSATQINLLISLDSKIL